MVTKASKKRTKPIKAIMTKRRGLFGGLGDCEEVEIPPHTGGACLHERSQVRYALTLRRRCIGKDGYRSGFLSHTELGRHWQTVIHPSRGVDLPEHDMYVERTKKNPRGYVGYVFSYHAPQTKLWTNRRELESFVASELRDKGSFLSLLKRYGYQFLLTKVDLWYTMEHHIHVVEDFPLATESSDSLLVAST